MKNKKKNSSIDQPIKSNSFVLFDSYRYRCDRWFQLYLQSPNNHIDSEDVYYTTSTRTGPNASTTLATSAATSVATSTATSQNNQLQRDYGHHSGNMYFSDSMQRGKVSDVRICCFGSVDIGMLLHNAHAHSLAIGRNFLPIKWKSQLSTEWNADFFILWFFYLIMMDQWSWYIQQSGKIIGSCAHLRNGSDESDQAILWWT